MFFFWQAFEYKKLLQDYNREVRRATHDTMTNLVVAVGCEPIFFFSLSFFFFLLLVIPVWKLIFGYILTKPLLLLELP